MGKIHPVVTPQLELSKFLSNFWLSMVVIHIDVLSDSVKAFSKIPNLKVACFVCCTKIINTYLKDAS